MRNGAMLFLFFNRNFAIICNATNCQTFFTECSLNFVPVDSLAICSSCWQASVQAASGYHDWSHLDMLQVSCDHRKPEKVMKF